MAPDGSIGGREAMEPWDHPKAMKGRRMPPMANGGTCMAHNSFHCLSLYLESF